MGDQKKSQQRPAKSLDETALEADVAFFDARLSLSGRESPTAYQKAQQKTYATLGKALNGTLKKLRAKRR